MAKKKKIIKKTPTRVHSFRCTDKDWKELNLNNSYLPKTVSLFYRR